VAPRKPKHTPVRNRAAAAHVAALAVKVGKAMSHGMLVNVTFRERNRQRRLVGRIVARRVREGWKATGDDGETSLEFDLQHDAGVETIWLQRVDSIERQRAAPEA
jgi:hypothetical protein